MRAVRASPPPSPGVTGSSRRVAWRVPGRDPKLAPMRILAVTCALFASVLPPRPVSAAAAGPRDDVVVRLAQLGDARADEREAATSWLRARLGPGDRAAIESALAPERRAPEEVRARLVEILASEERHVALAAELTASASAPARDLGRAALEQAIVRWNPALAENGARGVAALAALREGRDETLLIDDGLESAPLDELFELVVRFFPAGFRLVRDPACATVVALPRAPIRGTVESVLSELCVRHGLELVAAGFGDTAARGATRLVLFVPARAADEPRAISDRLVAWCESVATRRADAPACATALAASGWPAGIAWLATRASNDEAAHAGVLLAARRGQVPTGLDDPAAQSELRAAIDAALAGGERGAALVPGLVLALARVGNVGPRGEDLVAPALVGWADLAPRALHARVLELEVRRPRRADVAAVLEALLAREDVAPATRWMALLARVGAGDTPAAVARPRELVEWADARGFLADPSACPALGPAFPPAAWRVPAGLPSEWRAERIALVAQWWIVRGDADAAVALLERALRESTADERMRVVARLERVIASGAGDEVARVVRTLLAREDGALRRNVLVTAAMAGVGLDAGEVEALLRTLATPVVEREELAALAGIVAGVDGARARSMLLVAVGGPCAIDDAMAALDLAVRRLRATRDDALERAFARDVRARARASRQDLRTRVRVDSWPAPPVPVPVRLADFDRSFARAGL